VVQVRVKLLAEIVAGDMFSEKMALTAILIGTLVVGPGVLVVGTVKVTLGRVMSVVLPVVKCHTKGAKSAPVLRLVMPVRVAV
jgi:hypothetical protein